MGGVTLECERYSECLEWVRGFSMVAGLDVEQITKTKK
jgi:hypothetical protein